ncbi:MAG: PAS domain S-box protein [Leptolyngbyaceae cyanobacterium bins.349]|nr:PAS domain S-box protein [Leptolyngbyaceae cyanobacterium bins.349]
MRQQLADVNLNSNHQRISQLQQRLTVLQADITNSRATARERAHLSEQVTAILEDLTRLDSELVPDTPKEQNLVLYHLSPSSALVPLHTLYPEIEAQADQILHAPDPELIIRMSRSGIYLDFKPSRNFVPIADLKIPKGTSIYTQLPLELAHRFVAHIERALDTQEPQVFEFQLAKHNIAAYEEAYIVPIQPDEVLMVVRDISKRKHIENKLLKSEATNRALLETVPDLLIRFSAAGIYLDFKPSKHSKVLHSPETAMGKSVYDLLPFEVAQNRMALAAEALRTGMVQSSEYPLQIDGKLHYQEARIAPIGPDEVLIIVRDVSDRKDAEEALRRSEANLLALVENTEDFIWSMDTNYRLITLNEAFFNWFLQLYHHRLEPGCEILSYLPAAVKQYWKSLYDRALAGEHFSVEYQSVYSSFDRYLEVSLNPIRHNQTQQIVGVSIFSRDITTHKQAQHILETAKLELELKVQERTAELRTTIAQLSQEIQERQRIEIELKLRDRAVAASNNGIVICDAQQPDIPIIYVNPAFEVITGYSSAEAVGRNCRFLQGENTSPATLNILRSTLKAGKPCTVTLQNYRKDGSLFWNELSIAPIYDAGGILTHFVGIQTDITEVKQSEEEIHKALIRERELGELKSRFISMTSHEFRTPLTVILSSASLLENYSHRWNDEKKLTHLQRIQLAGQRMTQLLDDILVLSKAEADKLQYQPKSLDLVQFCQSLVADLQMSDNNQHQICFSCPDQLLPVCLDENLLQQILNNLLSNALKYSAIDSTIEFSLSRDQEMVVLQIRDQGIGIPASDLPHIFESFHRGHNVGTISGTGLGLTIVKKCVDLQHGNITVTSQEDMGTLFVVKLPAMQTEPNYDQDSSH